MGHPVLVIVGPTGIGKTAVAVALGAEFDAEIVNADSRQIYRHMDIGTAKPTLSEQAALPHHLIDLVEPDAVLSMAEYQERAYRVIADLHAHGKLPLMVGGTGQYVTAVLEGWLAPEVPPNPALRAELEAYGVEHGALALFERLRALDPVSGERMDPFNMRRTVRALEVCIETGEPFSTQRRKAPPDFRTLEIGLTLDDREALYTRLDTRIDGMMAAGLLDEVRALQAAGYSWRLPSMTGLGYAEIGAYLRGESSLEDSITAIKRNTRAFVRRQYTWFRKHGAIHWIEVGSGDVIETVRREIQAWL
jgi:tRNA dimethylallyltransferase